MQCYMQAGNISTDMKVHIDCTLPEFSATKTVTCNCHVDDSTKVRYVLIMGRGMLTSL